MSLKFRCHEMSAWKHNEICKLFPTKKIIINGKRDKGEILFDYEIGEVDHDDAIALQIENMVDENLPLPEPTLAELIDSLQDKKLKKIFKEAMKEIKKGA